MEEEQDGKERADYGKRIIKELSKVLTVEFGRGFSVDNLEKMRRFYIAYQKSATLSRISPNPISATPSRKSKTPSKRTESTKKQTVSDLFKLSWSHYLKLIWIDDEKEQLSTSKLSVSEIAYLLSFEHPSSFKKLYKPKT